MKLKRKIELFCGYLGEAIFLAIALGIFSIIFKEGFINNFLNSPFDFDQDPIVFFYILLLIGVLFLFIHAVFRVLIKIEDEKKII